MNPQPKKITIVGAGLVGSLMSIYLAKRGYEITVFEHRGDPRTHQRDGGRSINLALSNRGLRALNEVGLTSQIKHSAIAMNGRVMHDQQGRLTYQPYGMEGQYINSISRSDLNGVLITEAEKSGVTFFFDHHCTSANLPTTALIFQSRGKEKTHKTDWIIGADGAFSTLRTAFRNDPQFQHAQHYIEHGYKELKIPPDKNESFSMEKNALHIWPRESFMLIALPNMDGSFTATLFFPMEGAMSFNNLQTAAATKSFFEKQFPDIFSITPSLVEDFLSHPVASLVTVNCYPWIENNTLLIGDAAHAIVPFFGQGMNAGFEDCRVLNQLLDRFADRWDLALPEFQKIRKPDADAIAQLTLDNFVEMRDLVADPGFLLRKKIEARLHQLYPQQWIPLYSMVTFHDQIPYSEARKIGQQQKAIMDEVMKTPGIESYWEDLDFKKIVQRLD